MNEPTTDKPAHTPEPQLLPCPFCGGEAAISSIGNDITPKRSTSVKCTGCGCKLIVAAIRNNLAWTEGKVIEAWNKRKGIDDPAKALEQARATILRWGIVRWSSDGEECEEVGQFQRCRSCGVKTRIEKEIRHRKGCDVAAALSLLGAKDGMEGL